MVQLGASKALVGKAASVKIIAPNYLRASADMGRTLCCGEIGYSDRFFYEGNKYFSMQTLPKRVVMLQNGVRGQIFFLLFVF